MSSVGMCVLTIVFASCLEACSGPAPKTRQGEKGDAPKGAKSAVVSDTSTFATLGLTPFSFGPYLVASPTGVATQQISVEYGYTDVRETSGKGDFDIRDFRLQQVAAIAAENHFPTTVASGCQTSLANVRGAALGKTLSITEPVVQTLAFTADGRAIFDDRIGATAFVEDQALAASVLGLDGVVLTSIAGPTPPKAGSVQIAGAFDATISTISSIADLNVALPESTDDLLLADVGTGANYNVIVVTLYGGSDAAKDVAHCFIRPNGQATLPTAMYHDLLPLKGLFVQFAQVDLKTEGGVSVWTSAITGHGVEDLRVP